ncbi:MAG: hypothetical protein ABIH59_02470 [archaeon]
MIKEKNLGFLNQLVQSLEKAGLQLERAYQQKNHANFNKLKKFILEIQKKISEVII